MPPSVTRSDMDSLIRVETPSSLDSNNNPPENLTCPETTGSEGKELVNGLSSSDVCEERKGRYSLRPRSLLRPLVTDDVVDESLAEGGGDVRVDAQRQSESSEGSGASRRSGGGGSSRRSRRQAQPLSRYRRRTANARERERMREINAAFEALRRALPAGHPQQQQQLEQQQQGGDKVTKIATLRFAIRYIAELTQALEAVSSAAAASPPEEPRQALPPVSSLLTLTAGLPDDDSPLPMPLPLCLTPPPGLDDLCLEPR